MFRFSIVLRLILLMLLGVSLAAAPVQGQESPVIQLAVSEFLEDSFLPVVEQFEAQTGIQVELVTYAGFGPPLNADQEFDDYLDSAEAYFSSADVLFIDNNITPMLTRAGYPLNLAPLTQSDTDFSEDDFYDGMLRAFEWDGGQWGLPLSASYVTITYIPAAFDEAGLAYPTESWTLDDIGNAARALIERDAAGNVVRPGMLTIGFGDYAEALMLSLLGSSLVDTSTLPSQPQLVDAQLADLMTQWTELQEEGLFDLPSSSGTSTVSDFEEYPLQLGQGIGFFGIGEEGERPEKRAALLPGGSAGLTVNGYGVSNGTQNPEAAYELVKFLINSPTVLSTSLSPQSARRVVDGAEAESGSGGFFFESAPLPPEIVAIQDEALANALTNSDMLFSEAITQVLNMMQTDGLDAETALLQVQNKLEANLQLAEERGQAAPIVVNPPEVAPELAEGEIALNFAATAFISPLPNQDLWDAAATEFAAQDGIVGAVTVESEFPNSLEALTEQYDCFYSPSNFVDDGDLSVLLNIDPLFASDPDHDPGDFVNGALDQVQVNGQTWALPITVIPSVMRYNNDLFNQAGIIPPQGTWTVSEFEDALRSLQPVLSEGEASFQPSPIDQGYLFSLIAAYGGLPIDPRTQPVTLNFTEPETVDAIRQVLDLVKDGLIDYTALSGSGDRVFALGGEETVPMYSELLSPFGVGGSGGVMMVVGAGGGAPDVPTNPDGIVSYPRGTRYTVVPFDLGSAYISAQTLHAEACYRFIKFVSERPELFDTMPARRSVMADPNFVATQEEARMQAFQAIDQLLQESNALAIPTTITAGNFGSMFWLFDVFDRYVADEVIDLEADLAQAEQFTSEFLTCTGNVPPFDPNQDDPNEYFEQFSQCAIDVDPNAARYFPG